MNATILLLRISYLTGAVVDGFFAVALLAPRLWGMVLGLPQFAPDLQHRLDLALGASLMLSWSVLLLWADQKPLERKDVLLLTVFPALTCLAMTGIAAVGTGANSLQNMIHVFVLQGALASLFLVSYFRARRTESAA